MLHRNEINFSIVLKLLKMFNTLLFFLLIYVYWNTILAYLGSRTLGFNFISISFFYIHKKKFSVFPPRGARTFFFLQYNLLYLLFIYDYRSQTKIMRHLVHCQRGANLSNFGSMRHHWWCNFLERPYVLLPRLWSVGPSVCHNFLKRPIYGF